MAVVITLGLKKHVLQLKIISKQRNLQDETYRPIKKVMPHFYDIKTDPAFKEGKEEGIEKGIEKTERSHI